MLLIIGSAAAFVQQHGTLRTVLRAVEEVPGTPETPEVPPPPPSFDVKALPGVTGPFGFFDPLGLSTDLTEKRVLYFREAELKHGRVAMLAAVGFVVAEFFHPLFGGTIDAPSYVAFQQTPLQTFWPVVVLYIGVIEIFSVFTFESPFEGNWWTIDSKHKPGDFSFDPLDLKPTNPKEILDMQNKELNNGRLAMIGIAGMVAQELATGKTLF
ncbi:hypothetical protein CTAYLR_005540 [Chrysophaeum taylorii]|uniref:Uncharacterized protein n=1 Tax=Chrysophaeum taylorii TaxID=2483200 RepID=A0AAD7U6K1_9STRA|nr:hypothetical protein CTAYLR_005540 [Chrysophaeum taylorii]